MITKNLKPIFINLALVSSVLMASDDSNLLLSSDDTNLPSPPRNSPSLPNTDEAFEQLIGKLKGLSVNKKRIELWKEAISDFKSSLGSDSELSSLDQIKDKILQQDLVNARKKMAEKAIESLKNPSQLTSSNALIPGSKIPSVSNPNLSRMPIGLIIMSNVPVKQRPILSSEKKGSRFTALAIDSNEPKSPAGTKVLSPSEIAENLKKSIAAQDEAIDLLSTLAHRFSCNKVSIERGESVSCNSLHCILTGPTGCGKSETLKRLTELLQVPILYINARSLTDEGFKGQNFSECVSKFLLENRDARSAIVALEEIDKLESHEQDAKSFGRAIQQVLLTPLDGNPITIKDRQIPTSNWWFIGTGAFSGLKGMHDQKNDRITTVRTPQDIVMAGFEPEFVGRFPTIIPFKGHTVETMIHVMSKASSPIYRIKDEFKRNYGVNLTFKGAALDALASVSIEMNLGVRSLNSILNSALKSTYAHAITLMTATEEERAITVEFTDVKPAIDQFKRDNKIRELDLPPGLYI